MSNKKAATQFERYKAENRQLKNQAAKRARHAKRFPDDIQSQVKAVAGYKRKKPVKRGSAPAAARRVIMDKAGHKAPMPAFTDNPTFKPYW